MQDTDKKSSYIYYLNTFYRWQKAHFLSGNARLLYYSLLGLFNEAGWPESIQVDNYRLMSMVDTRTERVAISARDKLVDLGFIEYDKGKKRCPNTYRLAKCTPQKVSENDSVSDSVWGSEMGSVSGSVSVPKTVSHIKTKTKTKKDPPVSPQGDRGDGFDRFWQAYPKKKAKQDAMKAWSKLKPDKALLAAILSAVEQDKLSDQWQRDGGQYVPYPATWLKGHRWEDEPGEGIPEPSPLLDEAPMKPDPPPKWNGESDWKELIE